MQETLSPFLLSCSSTLLRSDVCRVDEISNAGENDDCDVRHYESKHIPKEREKGMEDRCSESNDAEYDRLRQLNDTIDEGEDRVDNAGEDTSKAREKIFNNTHEGHKRSETFLKVVSMSSRGGEERSKARRAMT